MRNGQHKGGSRRTPSGSTWCLARSMPATAAGLHHGTVARFLDSIFARRPATGTRTHVHLLSLAQSPAHSRARGFEQGLGRVLRGCVRAFDGVAIWEWFARLGTVSGSARRCRPASRGACNPGTAPRTKLGSDRYTAVRIRATGPEVGGQTYQWLGGTLTPRPIPAMDVSRSNASGQPIWPFS